jgi:glycosyltransferase involved in cell wall biosynthesis
MRSDRMHIVHVVKQVAVGGQERFILNLSRELVARGHQVSVVSMTEGGNLRRDFGRIPIVDVPQRPGDSALGLYARFARAFRELAPDVVHTHNPPPLLYATLAARAALVRRTVHTKHGANPYYTKATLAVARLATRTLTAFVSVSEGTDDAAQIRERPARRIAHVIPNGVPLDQFGADPTARGRIRAELGIPESAVVVGSVGRLAMEKDYPLLVRAMAPLLGEGTRLVLVGEGDHRAAIEAAIAEHVPSDRRAFICMTGGRRDVEHVLAAFDLFVLSSKTEGLPLVVPEAMASHLPIVATAVGGLPSIVPQTVGRLVPHGDAEALRGAIAELTESAEKRRTLGEAAHAYAHERFSLTQMASSYERLYRA